MQWREYVGQSRTELKGFAILAIVFFHSGFKCPPVLYYIKQLGCGGVDIFLFLSGFGLYYSLKRDSNLKRFWLRRCQRILPAYLPFIALWLVYTFFVSKDLTGTFVIRSITGNLFMNGFLLDSGRTFNWYVQMQFVFFLVAPFVFALLHKSKQPIRTAAILLAICYGVVLTSYSHPQQMALSRLPIFVVGMLFAMPLGIRWKRSTSRLLLTLSAILGIAILLYFYLFHVGLLYPFGLYWHPHVLIAPGVSILLCFAFPRASATKWRWMNAPFRVLGESSFEVYLVHLWVNEIAERAGATGNLLWLGITAGSIALGIGYHFSVQAVSRRIHQAKPSKELPA